MIGRRRARWTVQMHLAEDAEDGRRVLSPWASIQVRSFREADRERERLLRDNRWGREGLYPFVTITQEGDL